MANDTVRSYRRLRGTGYRRLVPGWAIILLFFVIGIFALLLRGRRVQLWLGAEHLLSVEWDGYREYYKRLRYADVQSVVIRRTMDGTLATVLLSVLVLVFGSLALATQDPAGRMVLLVVMVIFGLCLAVNAALGPTCQCFLRTAVQVEELPSLGRLRHARRALEQLQPLIVASQGSLTPEEIPLRFQELTTTMATTGREPPIMGTADVSPRLTN